MKLKLIIAAMLMFGIMAFMSCGKEKNYESSKEPLSISEWHNKALNSFLENNTLNNNTSREIVRNEIIDYLCKEDPNLFKREQLLENSIFFESDLKKQSFNSLKSTNTANIVENALQLTEYLTVNNYISTKLGEEIKNIYIQFGVKEPSSILSMVNNLKSNDWIESDLVYVNNFVEIFNSSNLFWTQYLSNTKSTASEEQEDALIILGADAIGALYGSIIPFWGSIVESTLFSAIAILEVIE
jgi:hypothetical protein